MGRPIVLLTLVFSLGIVLSKNIPLPIPVLAFCALIFLVLTAYAFFQKLDLNLFILFLAFLTGALSFSIASLPSTDPLADYVGKGYLTICGQVDDAPKLVGDGTSFPLMIDNVPNGQLSVWVNGGQELAYGDRVEVRGCISETSGFANPLMPDPRKFYKLSAAYLQKLPEGGGNPLKKFSLWFSGEFRRVLNSILPPEQAALLGSILLGTSVSPIESEIKNNYRKAGLIHLLVASGTQVSILIGVCLSLMKMMRLPNWLAICITTLFNILLVAVTGGGASIMRAAIMGEVMLLGLLFERQGEIFTTLSLSALVLLIADPTILFDIGFQLSFLATWALVYIVPVLKMPSLLAVTLAPLMATSPIIAFSFSQVSPGAIISNLIVIPWVEFLTVFGFLTTLLGFVFLPLAQLLANTLWLMLLILEKLVDFVPSLHGACFYIAAPSFVIIAGYYAGLIFMIEKLKIEGKLIVTRKRLAFALLILLSLFIWDKACSTVPLGEKQLVVTFIDVGQGDSILLETPGGKKILIDGGGVDSRGSEEAAGDDAIGAKVVVPLLHRKGINRLDMVILTHPHADHLGGLNKVLGEIPVDQVMDSGQVFGSRVYKRFLELVQSNWLKYELGRAGQVISFEAELTGYILNPSEPLLGDTNSDSIVMRLVYGDVSFLLTGDLGNPGEERVLQSYAGQLQSTVLKVGHHGSRTSTSDEFLRAVDPKFAVIQVGAHNRYRHPAISTMEKLRLAGIKTYRTDLNGAIVARTDGKELVIETQR